MISVELARKLKKSGLKWEPDAGDWFRYEKNTYLVSVADSGDVCSDGEWWVAGEIDHDGVWLPSLSQLLAEIERRGYGWELVNSSPDKYSPYIELIHEGAIKHGFSNDRGHTDDCVGQALLWILEQEGKNA